MTKVYCDQTECAYRGEDEKGICSSGVVILMDGECKFFLQAVSLKEDERRNDGMQGLSNVQGA